MRRAVVGGAAIVGALLACSTARAEESTVAWPHAVAHHGRVEGNRIVWQTTLAHNMAAAPDPTRLRIELARPFEGELEAARSPGVAAIVDGQSEVVALAIDPRRLPDWADVVSVTWSGPLTRDRDAVVLAPPIAAGNAVQRVELSGEGGLRFEPAPSAGLVRRMDSWSSPEVTDGDRRASDAELGSEKGALDESPIYLTATTTALDHGIRGRALTARERARPGLTLAAIAFVLLIAASVVGYRILGKDAQIERAEAVLREEFALRPAQSADPGQVVRGLRPHEFEGSKCDSGAGTG